MSSRSLLQSIGTSQATIHDQVAIVNRSNEPAFPNCRIFSSSACLRCLFAGHIFMTICCIAVILYYNWELKNVQRSYIGCVADTKHRTTVVRNVTEEILSHFLKPFTSELSNQKINDENFRTSLITELKNLTAIIAEEMMQPGRDCKNENLTDTSVDNDRTTTRNVSTENITLAYNITVENILPSSDNETEETNVTVVLKSDYSKFCSIFLPHCRLRSRKNVTTTDDEMADCTLKMIGKPISHLERLPTVGTFLLETWPTKNHRRWSKKRWLMYNEISAVLYEYDYQEYIGIKQPMKHYLDYLTAGTGSTVFNGSLYYHRHNSAFIVKYDLESGKNVLRAIPGLSYRDCPWQSDDNGATAPCDPEHHDPYLYGNCCTTIWTHKKWEFIISHMLIPSTWRYTALQTSFLRRLIKGLHHNFVDFAVDENGLFIIYTKSAETDRLVVSKLDGETMKIQHTWTIPDLNITDVGNAFVICGVVYTVNSRTDRQSFIDYSFDLRSNQLKSIDISWTNPFRNMVMTAYNPFQEQIYIYDNGAVVSVALKTQFEP